MPRQHSSFAPSGAERWTRCPYSVQATRDQEDRETEYAAVGTACHLWLNWCLSEVSRADARVGQVIYATELGVGTAVLQVMGTPERADWVQQAADFVRAIPCEWNQRWLEHPVDFGTWVPGGYGTADVVLLEYDWSRDDYTLVVIDAKFGTGHRVDAHGYDGNGNRQLLLYALGAYDELQLLYPIRSVRLVIVQPPLDHVSEMRLSVDELLAHGERFRVAALSALSDAPQAVPGDIQCRWCPAKAVCAPLAKHLERELLDDFETEGDLDLGVEASGLEAKDLGRKLGLLSLFERWAAALRQEAMARLLERDPYGVPGWKLVEGRSVRRWTDERAAARYLEMDLGMMPGDVFETKLRGIPAIEQKLGKRKSKLLEPVVVKPPGKPTLARDTDPRPAYTGPATYEDFESECEDE